MLVMYIRQGTEEIPTEWYVHKIYKKNVSKNWPIIIEEFHELEFLSTSSIFFGMRSFQLPVLNFTKPYGVLIPLQYRNPHYCARHTTLSGHNDNHSRWSSSHFSFLRYCKQLIHTVALYLNQYVFCTVYWHVLCSPNDTFFQTLFFFSLQF